MARKRIDSKVRKIVNDYIKVLKKDGFPLESVFVFGSRTTRRARKDSDIDVAIISPRLHNNLSSTRYLLKKAHQLESLEFCIEPHGFNPKEFIRENPFAWEVMKNGVQVKLTDSSKQACSS